VVLEIRALGLEVGRKTYDICDDLGVSCPIAQGSETLALFKYNVPWWAVTTVATLKLTATGTVRLPVGIYLLYIVLIFLCVLSFQRFHFTGGKRMSVDCSACVD
jgi:hypothetical protein